MTEESIHAL